MYDPGHACHLYIFSIHVYFMQGPNSWITLFNPEFDMSKLAHALSDKLSYLGRILNKSYSTKENRGNSKRVPNLVQVPSCLGLHAPCKIVWLSWYATKIDLSIGTCVHACMRMSDLHTPKHDASLRHSFAIC